MKRITALAVVVVLSGCSTVDSKDIRTNGITANLVVTLPESTDAAAVSASLRLGTLTFVELGDGEEITASGGGKSAKLNHNRAAGVTDYTNRLDGVVDPGTEITFDLKRDGDETVVLFTHAGWGEPVEFMHHCTTAWGYFLMSLKHDVEAGAGNPFPDHEKISSWA